MKTWWTEPSVGTVAGQQDAMCWKTQMSQSRCFHQPLGHQTSTSFFVLAAHCRSLRRTLTVTTNMRSFVYPRWSSFWFYSIGPTCSVGWKKLGNCCFCNLQWKELACCCGQVLSLGNKWWWKAEVHRTLATSGLQLFLKIDECWNRSPVLLLLLTCRNDLLVGWEIKSGWEACLILVVSLNLVVPLLWCFSVQIHKIPPVMCASEWMTLIARFDDTFIVFVRVKSVIPETFRACNSLMRFHVVEWLLLFVEMLYCGVWEIRQRLRWKNIQWHAGFGLAFVVIVFVASALTANC